MSNYYFVDSELDKFKRLFVRVSQACRVVVLTAPTHWARVRILARRGELSLVSLTRSSYVADSRVRVVGGGGHDATRGFTTEQWEYLTSAPARYNARARIHTLRGHASARTRDQKSLRLPCTFTLEDVVGIFLFIFFPSSSANTRGAAAICCSVIDIPTPVRNVPSLVRSRTHRYRRSSRIILLYLYLTVLRDACLVSYTREGRSPPASSAMYRTYCVWTKRAHYHRWLSVRDCGYICQGTIANRWQNLEKQ